MPAKMPVCLDAACGRRGQSHSTDDKAPPTTSQLCRESPRIANVIALRPPQLERSARSAAAELELRLAEDPEGFSVKELGVTTGILLDKIAKKERWGLEPKEGAGALDVLERLAERVARGELSLELKVSRDNPAERTIDVAPEDEA